VAREIGAVVYRRHGKPGDRGSAKAWAHTDPERVRERFAELTAARAFTVEHGVTSPTGAPCAICGVSHSHRWGRPPRPELGASPRPADLEVCVTCAYEWRRRAEETHGAIPSTLGDWAASEFSPRTSRRLTGSTSLMILQYITMMTRLFRTI
jgi:hypothetical protein